MPSNLYEMVYRTKLDALDTQEAIKYIKDNFEERLAYVLNLTRVSAPVMLYKHTGLNDYLSGNNENPVVIDAPHLDGGYASFGKVIEGIEVVDQIAKVRTSPSDRPLTPVVIESILIVAPKFLPASNSVWSIFSKFNI